MTEARGLPWFRGATHREMSVIGYVTVGPGPGFALPSAGSSW